MKKSIKFAVDETKNYDNEEEDDKIPNLKWKRSKSLTSNSSYNGVRIVEIRIIILKLGNLSAKENTFSCEAFCEATWLDKSILENMSIKNKDFKPTWTPNLYIKNLVSQQTQEIWYDCKETHHGHKISEKRRFRGELSQAFDLRNFPLDQQELLIYICTYHNSNEVKLVVNKEKLSMIELSSFTQTHEWYLHSTLCSYEKTKQNDFTLETHSCIDVSICVTRKPIYYFWNSFLLIFIISTICLCCFSIRCDIAANRLIVGITVFLTLITFKWSLSKNHASISYLTCLDKYTLTNIFIVFINCIYFAIMGILTTPNCDSPFNRIDFFAFITSISIFMFLNGSFVVKILIYRYKNGKKLRLREEETKKFDMAKRARIKSIFQS